jgi:hypothetical protein
LRIEPARIRPLAISTSHHRTRRRFVGFQNGRVPGSGSTRSASIGNLESSALPERIRRNGNPKL